MLAGCSGNTGPSDSTNANHKQGDGQESGKLVKWANDALKVSFLYPERSKVSVIPGEHSGRVQVVGGSPVTVDLDVQIISPTDNSTFKAKMEEDFNSKAASIEGYQEYSRKYYEVDEYPTAFIDFKCIRGGRESHNLELYTAKGNYEYNFLTIFLAGSDDVKNKAAATAIINSFHLMKGIANLAALSVQESGQLVKWANDALKASFLYPEGAKVSINPNGSKNSVQINGIGTSVRLYVMDTPYRTQCSMEDFKTQIEEHSSFGSNAKYPGYQENNRKFYMIDGYPTAFVDYKYNIQNEDCHCLELWAAKGECYYICTVSFSSVDDNKYKSEATKIINSFHLAKGEPNLDAFNGK